MITNYYRPQSLAEAIRLLENPNTRPLGGGTILNQKTDESFEVVDLQALGLDKIHKSGEKLVIGAMATLQSLLESPHSPEVLKSGITLEAPLNLRNMKTVAGTLVASDGRSPFTTIMLALDAKITMECGPKNGGSSSADSLGNLLPVRREALKGKLITSIEIPLNATIAFEKVARTPADRPIVCTAMAHWISGRTRLALGGWGEIPVLAMDGNNPDGVEIAARNAFHEAGDGRASAEYRRNVASVLAMRCLEKIHTD